jgi:VWFA-related protein
MFRHRLILTVGFLIALSWLNLAPARTPSAPGKKKKPSPQAETAAAAVIMSESNVVLVDVIVTDKNGHYLRDMNQKEFHVLEDGAEQPITSFSREADIKPGAPERQRYIVIFFDNAGLDSEGQMWERGAASNFVQSTASPHRMMAVMDYGNGLRVAQNFTTDRDLLMSAVRKTKFAPFQTSTDEMPRPHGGQRESDLAPRNLLLAIRDVARMLGTAPGRKTILFLSAGFDLISGRPADYQDTIVALNKANVGVYTISARGLVGLDMASGDYMPPWTRDSGLGVFGGAPSFPGGLIQLAAQTGGYRVVNVNDLPGEMQKVSEEMDEYYLLGYVPPNPVHDGRYHKILVKVDRAGTEVRARNGYADTKSPDILAGKTEGMALEAKAASFEAGEISVALSTPYFYVRPGIARVNLALSIPTSAVDFEKHGDNFRSQMSVLGIAYRSDGSVAARFSDTVNLNYEKDEMREERKANIDYQNFIMIAPGEYMFKLVLSAGGGKFGKYVVPLMVDEFSGKQFTLSGPAFGDRSIPSPLSSADIDQKLIEGSVPMVANGLQVVPSSNSRFKKNMEPVVYVEVYDPLLESGNPQMGILFDIVNQKTKEKVYSSSTLPINENVHPGNPLVPAIFKLPMDKLPPGDYRIEIRGRDSAGNATPVRTGDFSIE